MKKRSKTADSRAHLLYTGRVQGVGFRYTAENIAQELGLVGWVRNLPNGGVEIICEGDHALIESLMEKIQQSQLGPHIKKCVCDWQKPTGEFTEFRVEFVL